VTSSSWILPGLAALAALAPGCTGDVDPPWQLDHDRIIAVRADPPRIAPGQTAVLDALIGSKGAAVAEASPDTAAVVSPVSLAGALRHDAGRWIVTAPSEADLVAARSALGLAVDAPVPLEIAVSYRGGALAATKSVRLGGVADNPTMVDIKIDRASAPEAAAPEAPIVVAPAVDVPLSIPLDDAGYDVTWLSSCGTMHDFDLPTAYLRVESDDPQTGQLALVVRDSAGGVSWRVWPIEAR